MSELHRFQELNPEVVLDLVERAMGIRLTNLFRPLNSYINRVYELQDEEDNGLIVKFYRPGRWSRQALVEEHDFLVELAGDELPVIAPLEQLDGSTLGDYGGIAFALFPKRGGRSVDEFTDEQWMQLGRLLGRVHQVGARREAAVRPVMTPGGSMRSQLDYLLAGRVVPAEMKDPLREVVEELSAEIEPLFAGQRLIRIHGDCHFANIIHRPDEGFFLIDFDDMVTGPPIQDIWMLLPGTIAEAFVEVDMLLEGYETFLPFDRRSFRLVEPLRAMRFVHYMAWCAHQVAADGYTRVLDDFGSQGYWQQEIAELRDQLERIRDDDTPLGNVW